MGIIFEDMTRAISGKALGLAFFLLGILAARGEPSVTGRVVTPEGCPVGGAKVLWVGDDRQGSPILDTRVTDRNGRIQFENAADFLAKDSLNELLVEASGWALTPANFGDWRSVEIAVKPRTEVCIAFVDESGKPLPGVRVAPETLLSYVKLARDPLTGLGSYSPFFFVMLPEKIKDRLASVTDAQGKVRFRGLPQGARLRLAIEDDRFANLAFSEDIALSNGPESSGARVVLLPAATMEGRVVCGPTGSPASGIRVSAQGADANPDWGEAMTDNQGKYVIKNLRPGTYNVALDLNGGNESEWTACAHEKVRIVKAESKKGLNFLMISGAVITGKALEEGSGRPLSGIPIAVYGPAHPRSSAWVQVATTKLDGSYVLRVPPGRQYVYYEGARLPPGVQAPIQKSRDVDVKDGDTTEVNFAFPVGTTVAAP